MPRGDKKKYTDKEEKAGRAHRGGLREAGHSEDEAKRRAWATVNAVHKGGKSPGRRMAPENHEPMRTGGRTSHRVERTDASNADTLGS